MKIKDAQLGHDHNQNKDQTKKKIHASNKNENKETKPRLLETNYQFECLQLESNNLFLTKTSQDAQLNTQFWSPFFAASF